MKCWRVLLKGKIRLKDFFYNQKKGRKNSAPKATLMVTFSPDGAVIVRSKSSLGSHSAK